MNRLLVILMFVCLKEGQVDAQHLDDFEDDGCEQEVGDEFAARFAYSFIKLLSQSIGQLDAPDFGRFPYSEGNHVFRMNERDRQKRTPFYNSFSGGYQQTDGSISTL